MREGELGLRPWSRVASVQADCLWQSSGSPLVTPGQQPPGRPGWTTGFRPPSLPWCDGRCVQGPGTYSPPCADRRLLATPPSGGRVAAPHLNWDRVCRDWLPLARWRPAVPAIVACVSPEASGPCRLDISRAFLRV